MTENSKELVSRGMLLESILDGIPLTILGTPQCTTGTYQLVLRNDATAAISISSMEGLLRRVRHIELRAKYIIVYSNVGEEATSPFGAHPRTSKP